VRAVQIALSKDEGTLYFTDTRNLVRKILLR
jgi:sugar lactone lactonase YvrE